MARIRYSIPVRMPVAVRAHRMDWSLAYVEMVATSQSFPPGLARTIDFRIAVTCFDGFR